MSDLTRETTYQISLRDLRSALSGYQHFFYTIRPGKNALLILAGALFIYFVIPDEDTFSNFSFYDYIHLLFIFMLFTAFGVATITVFKIWILPARAAKRQYSVNARMHERYRVYWDEKSITFETQTRTSTYPWKMFYAVVEQQWHFLFMLDERVFMFIPKHALSRSQRIDIIDNIPYHNRF